MKTESVPVDPHLRKHNGHLSRDLRSTISFRNVSSASRFAYNAVIRLAAALMKRVNDSETVNRPSR